MQPGPRHDLGQAARARGDHRAARPPSPPARPAAGSPGSARGRARRPRPRRSRASSAASTRPVKRTSPPAARSADRLGPVARDDERDRRRSGTRRSRRRRPSPASGARRRARTRRAPRSTPPRTRAGRTGRRAPAPSGAPSVRSRSSANSLGTMQASAASVDPPLPQREPGAVGGRLGARAAAAVQPHARARVAPVAARAVGAAGEAGPDRADEPVVVQVQDDPGAGLARGGQRAPAERRLDVVRVDDARAGAPHRVADLVRAPGRPASSPSAARPRPSAALSRSSTSASSPSSVRISQARSATARSSPPATR